MTSKRLGLISGGVLAGALLLGTAGLTAAQNPTAMPTPSPSWTGPGGMMNGQGMAGGMSADHVRDMTAILAAMTRDGTCDPATMQQLQATDNPSR